MRHLIVVVVLTCGIQLFSALEPIASSKLPTPQEPDGFLNAEILADQLWGIAAAAHVRIGFESIEETMMPRPLRQTAIANTPIADAIDAALAVDDRYEWRAIAGIIVVRPKGAWTDSADPLNRPIRNVQVRSVVPTAVLHGLRDFLYSGRFAVNPALTGADPVSFQVASGTVLDVLNQLVTASDQAMWLAYHRRSATGETSHRWSSKFELRDTKQLTSLSASPMLVPPYR
jgi:hypothetical protein